MDMCTHRGMPQGELDHFNVTCGTPPLRNERLAPNVVIKHVQRLINRLLLANEILPAEQTLANSNKLGATGATGVVQGQLEVLNPCCHLTERLGTLIRVWIDGVDGRPKGLGDSADFRKQCLTMREDDKDVLVRGVAGCSIDERIGNVCVVHVKVTAKDTPEDALKGRQASAIDYTGDKSNR
jgi:hypothetical protein